MTQLEQWCKLHFQIKEKRKHTMAYFPSSIASDPSFKALALRRMGE
jgi:hypothetical protein